jgi:hypothetical protein
VTLYQLDKLFSIEQDEWMITYDKLERIRSNCGLSPGITSSDRKTKKPQLGWPVLWLDMKCASPEYVRCISVWVKLLSDYFFIGAIIVK